MWEVCLDRHVVWKNKVTKDEVLSQTGQRRLRDVVGEKRFRFVGHIVQMAPEAQLTAQWTWTTAVGRRKIGRAKKTWWSTFLDDVQARGVSWSEVEVIVADRVRWLNLLPIVL